MGHGRNADGTIWVGVNVADGFWVDLCFTLVQAETMSEAKYHGMSEHTSTVQGTRIRYKPMQEKEKLNGKTRRTYRTHELRRIRPKP